MWSGRLACVAVLALALVQAAACARGTPRPQGLTTAFEPELLEAAATWGEEDAGWRDLTVRWLDDDRLFLERTYRQGQYAGGYQLWVDVSRPGEPRVAVRLWTGEGVKWHTYDIDGRAWISSDGSGLGAAGGPDLAIEYELVGERSGSPSPSGGKVLVPGERLRR